MENWKTTTLGEVTSFMAKGIPPKYVEQENDDTIRVLNQKCNRNYRISYAESRLHNNAAKKVPEWKMLKPGDVLINSTGAGTAGRVAQIWSIPTPTTIDGHMILLRPTEEVDPLYYGYAVKENQALIESYAEGSTGQTEINKERLKSETIISFPEDMNLQRIIARTLAAIDEKIEENERINKNLYQQLFALYDYYRDSADDGEIELGALCQFQEGYVNPAQTHPEYFDGDVKWLRAVDINESFIIETSRTLTQTGFQSAKKSAYLFSPNTIAISKSGTIGRLGIVGDYMCGNRAVINIAPKDPLLLPYIYAFLKSHQKQFPDLAVGSVQKNLYVSLLEPLPVRILAPDSLSEFCNAGNAILNAVYNNCQENIRLAQLRDTLLPRLMTGELDVSRLTL